MSRFKEGLPRNQLIMFPETIDEYISEENPVRFINAFVNELSMSKLGFKRSNPMAKGTSPYNPKDLLKLYIYGYLNKIRSSRKLAKEIRRNVELMWLLKKLKPDFKTISDFRKNNLKGIQNVCKQFTLLCKDLGLLSSNLVAIDGSKFKACNSLDRNYSLKYIEKKISKIDESITKYLQELDKNDNYEKTHKKITKPELLNKIESMKEKLKYYSELEKKLKKSGETEVSLTDPDSRLMKDKKSFVIGYNVQSVVDSENHIIVAHEVVQDKNDLYQLSKMAKKSQEIMQSKSLKVVADKGYYTEDEIVKTKSLGIEPNVIKPKPGISKKYKDLYPKDKFHYNKEKDHYVCPVGENLKFTGTGKSKKRLLRYYETSKCKLCKLKLKCTSDKRGRRITRSSNIEIIEEMVQRMKIDPDIALKRKSIVEHPFGTIKRGLDQEYFLLRGLEKVKTEMSLSVLVYNMKRVLNIFDIKYLIKQIV